MNDTGPITKKINEVKEEMKRTGLWATSIPPWVVRYGNREMDNREHFSEWMQFVYLPNRDPEAQPVKDLGKERGEKNYIAPQAIKFFGADIQKGKLLQLLIELDSL